MRARPGDSPGTQRGRRRPDPRFSIESPESSRFCSLFCFSFSFEAVDSGATVETTEMARALWPVSPGAPRRVAGPGPHRDVGITAIHGLPSHLHSHVCECAIARLCVGGGLSSFCYCGHIHTKWTFYPFLSVRLVDTKHTHAEHPSPPRSSTASSSSQTESVTRETLSSSRAYHLCIRVAS